MEQILLNIKDKSKIPFLTELLGHLDFVEIVEPRTYSEKEQEILNDLEESADFVNEYKKGNIDAKSFNQLLNEL